MDDPEIAVTEPAEIKLSKRRFKSEDPCYFKYCVKLSDENFANDFANNLE